MVTCKRHQTELSHCRSCTGLPVSCVLCTGEHERAHGTNGHPAEQKAAAESDSGGDGCGPSCDPLPDDDGAGTFDLGFSRDGRSDPRKDVVLRIEAETEAETKV